LISFIKHTTKTYNERIRVIQINVCKSLNPQSFRGGKAPLGPLTGLCPGPAGDLKWSPDPSPTHALLTTNPGSAPAYNKPVYNYDFSLVSTIIFSLELILLSFPHLSLCLQITSFATDQNFCIWGKFILCISLCFG
jgi:hypothetical protein